MQTFVLLVLSLFFTLQQSTTSVFLHGQSNNVQIPTTTGYSCGVCNSSLKQQIKNILNRFKKRGQYLRNQIAKYSYNNVKVFCKLLNKTCVINEYRYFYVFLYVFFWNWNPRQLHFFIFCSNNASFMKILFYSTFNTVESLE